MEYREIYPNLLAAFGQNEFSFGELIMEIPGSCSTVRKVVHDMVKGGYLNRIGRGRYVLNSPQDYFNSFVRSYGEVETWFLRNAPYPYSFSGGTAVSIWTRGGYNAGGTRLVKPIDIDIRKGDLRKWKRLFEKNGFRYVVDGETPHGTIVGVVLDLHPKKALKSVAFGGRRVVPLKEAIAFCRANAYTYEPALEMFDRIYGKKTGVRYDTY